MTAEQHPAGGEVHAPGNIPVLMYHRIGADNSPHRSEYLVTKAVFRKQMEYLVRHGYFTPRLETLLHGAPTESTPEKRPVIVTLDDGYLDNFECALPVLQEMGLTAVLSVVADWSRRVNWWDTDPALAGVPLMESRHVAAMAAAGIECASHSLSHRSLPCLSSRDMEEELIRSRVAMEEVLQRAVSVFAYPYGDVDERVKAAARNAGYACAFATNSGPFRFSSDLFEIRRVRVLDRADEPYLYALFGSLLKRYMWSKWTVKRMMGLHNRYKDE